MLPRDLIQRHNLRYTILDISERELAKAHHGYHTQVADIGSNEPPACEAYDLIFSKMLAEHVRDAEPLHRNVFHMLRSGGVAVHFFPTLFCLPFAVNRMTPDFLSELLLHTIQPWRRAEGPYAKFPAFYSWCRGPTVQQIRRFQRLGFQVLEYDGFFGHGYYDRFPRLRRFQDSLARTLLRWPMASFTTFAQVVLAKPAISAGSVVWRNHHRVAASRDG